jgi:hypothetical protein
MNLGLTGVPEYTTAALGERRLADVVKAHKPSSGRRRNSVIELAVSLHRRWFLHIRSDDDSGSPTFAAHNTVATTRPVMLESRDVRLVFKSTLYFRMCSLYINRYAFQEWLACR